MSDPVFRSAIEFDYAFLADAFCRSFEGYVVAFQFDARALEQRARPENWDLAASIVAFCRGELAGVLFTARRGGTCRVAAMGVIKSARGQGVGRSMMQRCVAEARQREDRILLLEVIASNTAALRLYESVGLIAQRRLVGFECAEPSLAGQPAAITEMDPADFAKMAHAEYEPNLPWQMRPETLAHATRPSRAFSLEDRAFALIGDPAGERVGLRGIVVRSADRRHGHGVSMLRALFARYPGKTWFVPAIVPEGLADHLFCSAGFSAGALTQFEMSMALTDAQT
jgi:GNAT superfamily N-acetyltransferase